MTRIMRTIGIAERRARLARRHRLAPGHRARDVVDPAESMVCLHATDPATVFMSAWARVGDLAFGDVERALYQERSLVKHLAMRRTVFLFPRDALPVAQAAASNRVAANEQRRLIREVEEAGLRPNGDALVVTGVEASARRAVRRPAGDLLRVRDEMPMLAGGIAYGEGKSWGGTAAVAPRC